MNIKEAKEQIKNAMTAYFTKDEFGNYEIPIERQRPVFLMGAPGIGKTAIMEQVAQELGVGLVSYSMTHHTRQSALGLPFISQKTYGGKQYSVSEYTMSEIIASVYDMIEETGVKEGILFLDEINCVSETLAPAMLQFLQFKIFGRHRVPDGWIVVTAGNPPEYNKSVREFDTVTWDRLKRIDVEPDFKVWKEYAYKRGVHPAVMTYLEIKPQHFYKMETTVDGKSFVTARGWDDLSEMMKLYEKNGIDIDQSLVEQYIQNKKIASDFAGYYELYNKYRSDYKIDEILAGETSDEIKERAKSAKFDERLALLGMMLDRVTTDISACIETENVLKQLLEDLREVKTQCARPGIVLETVMDSRIIARQAELENGVRSGMLSKQERHNMQQELSALGQLRTEKDFDAVRARFAAMTGTLSSDAEAAGAKLSNMFSFCEEVFAGGSELLILVTELTVSHYASRFISRYGCEEYFRHNKELMFYERKADIMGQIDALELD